MEAFAAEAVQAVSLGESDDLNFSMVELFLRADIVVKAVMISLILASLWCWAVVFQKITAIRGLNNRANKFETMFWSGESLDDLYDAIGDWPKDPMSAVFAAAMREWRRTPSGAAADASLTQRIERVMQIAVDREMDRAERYLTFLATTGSTAPFIGLFGTVWGIMNSFSPSRCPRIRRWRSSRLVSRRRCLRRRWGYWPLFPPSSPTISSAAIWTVTLVVWRTSPANFPRSCRGTARSRGAPIWLSPSVNRPDAGAVEAAGQCRKSMSRRSSM